MTGLCCKCGLLRPGLWRPCLYSSETQVHACEGRKPNQPTPLLKTHMTSKYDNLISGEWIAATSYAPNINPSNLLDVIGEYAQASAAQLEAAVLAARAGVDTS